MHACNESLAQDLFLLRIGWWYYLLITHTSPLYVTITRLHCSFYATGYVGGSNNGDCRNSNFGMKRHPQVSWSGNRAQGYTTVGVCLADTSTVVCPTIDTCSTIRLFGQVRTLKQFVHGGFFNAVRLAFATMGEGYGFESPIFDPTAHGGVVNAQAAGDFADCQ